VPATIRVLSWNVESLGDTKAVQPGSKPATASELINFINLVVRGAAADVVGIMELKSGQGQTVCAWLLAKLNNGVGGGVTWKGVVSSRQDGGTMEEYIVLWKEQANRLRLDPNARPAPASLIGVADDNAFSRLYDAKGWKPNGMSRATFNAALSTAGYVAAGRFKLRSKFALTGKPRVLPDAWNTLNQMAQPQVQWSNKAPPPGGLTTADERDIAATLLDVDILRFNTYGDRSPFLVNLLVGTQPRPLAIVLLHAPGPQDRIRTDAINIIGLSRPAGRAAAGGNLLVMGDFNIAANQGNLTARVYGRFTNPNHQFVFAQAVPAQYALVFAPIAGGPLNAPDLLPNIRTSLVNAYLADNSPLNAVLANTFDKFFFRGAAAMNQANPRVINLVDVMNAASANYNAPIAKSGLSFFRALRGLKFLAEQDKTLQRNWTKRDKDVTRLTKQLNGIVAKIAAAGPLPGNSPLILRRNTVQNSLNTATQARAAIQTQRNALAAMNAVVINFALDSPTGVGTALTTYRFAVSDHLPITVDLTA
jgi:hypothetical protein